MTKFKNKVVLVTGAARGIGREIAECFAQEGATIALCDMNPELTNKTRDEMRAKGYTCETFLCDVTNLEKVEEMANNILDKYKSIDILVNNAGITRDNLILRMKESDWDAVISVNLKGTFNCTKVMSRIMLKAQSGKIISIASIIGITGNAGQVNYAASKAGVIALTKSIAKELASRGITVNAVAPGFIQTDMTAQLNEKAREEISKRIPLGKLGTARHVADACVFLASPQADYITGQTIVVDGGLAM